MLFLLSVFVFKLPILHVGPTVKMIYHHYNILFIDKKGNTYTILYCIMEKVNSSIELLSKLKIDRNKLVWNFRNECLRSWIISYL